MYIFITFHELRFMSRTTVGCQWIVQVAQGLIIPVELIIKTDKNILEQERPSTRHINHGPHIPPVADHSTPSLVGGVRSG